MSTKTGSRFFLFSRIAVHAYDSDVCAYTYLADGSFHFDLLRLKFFTGII